MILGMHWFIFTVSWIIAGVLSFLLISIIGMRGKPYNEDFYEEEGSGLVFMLSILLGYTSCILVIVALSIELDMKEKFTRLIYKIANIGIKDKSDEE